MSGQKPAVQQPSQVLDQVQKALRKVLLAYYNQEEPGASRHGAAVPVFGVKSRDSGQGVEITFAFYPFEPKSNFSLTADQSKGSVKACTAVAVRLKNRLGDRKVIHFPAGSFADASIVLAQAELPQLLKILQELSQMQYPVARPEDVTTKGAISKAFNHGGQEGLGRIEKAYNTGNGGALSFEGVGRNGYDLSMLKRVIERSYQEEDPHRPVPEFTVRLEDKRKGCELIVACNWEKLRNKSIASEDRAAFLHICYDVCTRIALSAGGDVAYPKNPQQKRLCLGVCGEAQGLLTSMYEVCGLKAPQANINCHTEQLPEMQLHAASMVRRL